MTGKQLDLEAMTKGILSAPYQRHSPTSKAAAKEIEFSHRSLKFRLLNWLYVYGPATDLEMQEKIPMNPSTQRPRRIELQKAGYLVDSGEKRKTRSGRSAVVWEVV